MNRGFWFLMAAIAMSWFALDLMLDKPASFTDSQVRAGRTGERESKPLATSAEKIGIPAVSGKSETAGMSNPKMPYAPAGGFSSIGSKEVKPEMLTPAGIPVADGEAVDIQEIEDRRLAEQLAESRRNPAYLSGAYLNPSEPIDPEDSGETEETAVIEELAESLKGNELTDSGGEEEPQDDSAFHAAEANEDLSKEDQSAERVYMTEAGYPIGGEIVDVAEIEERMLKAQLEESLRNPAYLQASPAEHDSVATEDDD